MRNLLLSLIAFGTLITTTSCSGQKKSIKNVGNVDLELICKQNLQDSTLVTGWYYIIDAENGFGRQLDKSEDYYFIDPKPILVKEHFGKAEVFETDFKGQYEDYIGLSVRIDKKYVDLWADATGKSIGKRLGLIIDNKLVNAPQVNARIEGGMTALNRGVYSKEELEIFKRLIE